MSNLKNTMTSACLKKWPIWNQNMKWFQNNIDGETDLWFCDSEIQLLCHFS